jgi:putative phosphoesterase
LRRIGIISDTHAKPDGKKGEKRGIPRVVLERLRGCNQIVHCGDIGLWDQVVPVLEKIAPVVIIKGNHDKRLKEKIPWSVCMTIEGWRLWVVHGHGGDVRHNPLSIIKSLKEPADIILFGHIHRPLVYADKEIILVNPGSTSSTDYTPFASFIIMLVAKERISITTYLLNKDRTAVKATQRAVLFKSKR